MLRESLGIMMNLTLKFIGLAPGFPPWGRQPLFRIESATALPFHQGDVIPMGTALSCGVEIADAEKVAVNRALVDWDNSAGCDDNLLRSRR